MVDCGSLNTLLPGGENFKNYAKKSLTARYSGVPRRAFLLSHFHRDHVCGLWNILDCCPNYFSEIYLPCSPCDERGLPLLLEFALFAYVFLPRQGYCGQVSLSALRAFSRALRGAQDGTVYALGQGDTFASGDTVYQCLWPPRQTFPFDTDFVRAVEQLHLCVESPYQPGGELLQAFLKNMYEFGQVYTEFCTQAPVQNASAARALAVLDRIDDMLPALNRLPAGEDVRVLLESRAVREAYSEQENAASLVFQNQRGSGDATRDVLFTGDATPETIAAIEPQLYHDYYLLKVPHHGLAGAVSPVLLGISAAHLVISGGELPGSTARPAEEWTAAPGMKHCTFPQCAYLEQSNSCCERTAMCWESGGLVLRCPGNRGKEPPCGIRVLGRRGQGCICDLAESECRFW
jgi:hypothetical protein